MLERIKSGYPYSLDFIGNDMPAVIPGEFLIKSKLCTKRMHLILHKIFLYNFSNEIVTKIVYLYLKYKNILIFRKT